MVPSKTFGGVGSYLTEMNRKMSGNTVFDYVIEGSECSIQDRLEHLGGKVYYISNRIKNPFLNLQENRKLLKSLRKTHTAIYFNLSTLGWIEPIKIAVSLGYRVFVHSHTSRLLVDDFKHRLIYKINKKRLSHLNISRLSCSKKATEYMYFPNDQVQFIHNAVDINMFKFNQDERNKIRAELKISDKTKVIGYVGRLVDQKNVLALPDILKSVIQQDENVVMILLGEGNLKEKLLEKICELNLQNRCLLLGDRSDIYRYYQAMDVFLLPSLFEGLPIVMVEAQVSGLPCIVSDTISSESDISGNVSFVSLDSDANHWGEVINQELNNQGFDRERVSEKLRHSDFDIDYEALRLEKNISRQLINSLWMN